MKCSAWRAREAAAIAARRGASPSSAITAAASASGSRGAIRMPVLGRDRLARAADVGRHLRHAARQRLEHADRERLPRARQHVDVERAQRPLGRRVEGQELDLAGVRMRAQGRRLGPVAGDRHPRARGDDRGRGVEQDVEPLLAPQDGDGADGRPRVLALRPRALARAGSRCGPRAAAPSMPAASATARSSSRDADQRGGAGGERTLHRRGRSCGAPWRSRPRTGSSAACRPRDAGPPRRRSARARRPWRRARARGQSSRARARARPNACASRCGCP